MYSGPTNDLPPAYLTAINTNTTVRNELGLNSRVNLYDDNGKLTFYSPHGVAFGLRPP